MSVYDSVLIGKVVLDNSTIVDSVIINESDLPIVIKDCMIINSELNLNRDCVNSSIVDTKSNHSYKNVKIEKGKIIRINVDK